MEVAVTNYSGQEGDVGLSTLSSLDARDSRVGLHSIVPGGESQSIIRIDDSTHGQLYSGSTLLRASLMADEAPVRAIVARERRWRTRVSVLQSQGKTFYENIVLGILRNVIVSYLSTKVRRFASIFLANSRSMEYLHFSVYSLLVYVV